MDPMPRSITWILVGLVIVGVIAAVVAHTLTPAVPTHTELADRARQLSDELGLDRAETETLLAGCAGIVEGYGRIWSGMASVRYEACLREANLLD
jgi:hypothetical protein